MYFQGVAKDKHAALLKNVDTEHHYKGEITGHQGWLK